MEQNVFDVLKERGFIEQTTHEAEIRELLGKEKVTFYIGFDATADSLTAGHFLTIMAMMHMQRAGHRPIALLGGGTTMIGDPSGKSDMRNMMTKEKIDYNAKRFHEQLSRFIDFDNDKAIIANNADWLLDLNYVEFLREIGVHFSVNKMLTAECYKQRMERGLTFFEFNYMLMQSYDFLKLNQLYGCQMEPVILCILYSFMSTTVGDRLMKSGREAICFEIITNSPQEVSRELINRLHHTATFLPAKGMYSGRETSVLLCVVNKTQVALVSQIVHKYPHTFAIVHPVSEILGNFKNLSSSGKEVVEVLDAGDRKTL